MRRGGEEVWRGRKDLRGGEEEIINTRERKDRRREGNREEKRREEMD